MPRLKARSLRSDSKTLIRVGYGIFWIPNYVSFRAESGQRCHQPCDRTVYGKHELRSQTKWPYIRGAGETDKGVVPLAGENNRSSCLEFRTEFFNLFTHPQFGFPDINVISGSTNGFGQATSQQNNPRLIQFALKFVFNEKPKIQAGCVPSR